MNNEKYRFKNGILEVKIIDRWKNIEFPGYEFIDVIGEGANGVVIKARHQVTERTDAIKIWLANKKSSDGKVSQEQYLREVRKISKLKDEHIVTIYDAKIYDDADDAVYMCAMEYIEGRPLKVWIKENHDIKDRIQICYEILQTIENYQQADIIHGDLHGGNIIIDKNEHIHIIDFGTSLFGHDNQSKERESYFVYDLVSKILKDEFRKELFSIKNYGIGSKIENCDDLRRYEPLLITKTMLHFVKLRDIKYQTVKITCLEVLYEYCENIAKGIYFNLDQVFIDLLDWSDENLVRSNFARILYANIHNTIFGSSDLSAIEELKYLTLYIYYEKLNDYKNNISIIDSKNHYMENYKGFLTEEMYDEYINDLYDVNCTSYIEYREHLLEIFNEQELYDREEKIRSILADLMENYYKQEFIYVLYDVWKRVNEIRMNAELYSEIKSMTELIYKEI